MKTLTMTQHIRNQLSLVAWAVAALCAWLLFLAAAASASPANATTTHTTTITAHAPKN
jgi:hypothetical protein